MNRASLGRLLQILPLQTGGVAALLFVLLFAGGNWQTSPGFIGSILREVAAVARDPSTQCMLVICLVGYFVVFLFLERRAGMDVTLHLNLPSDFKVPERPLIPAFSPMGEKVAAGRMRGFRSPDEAVRVFATSFNILRGNFSNPNLWLTGFVILALLRYALKYDSAVGALQLPVLLAGLVFGKGIAVWVGFRHLTQSPHPQPLSHPMGEGSVELSPIKAEREKSRRIVGIILILLALLAASALWQPATGMRFAYHGVPRWSGVWDNPNLYGLLMGTGLVLAVGLGMRGWKIEDGRWKNALCLLLCFVAAMLTGYGLFKSYSRGAWFGTGCGLAFLLWNYARLTLALNTRHLIRPPSTFSPSDAEKGARSGGGEFISCNSCVSWLKKNWLALSVVLLSVLVLGFWQFRFAEARPAQRLFSVGNLNDFSWRNRVTAWTGAGRMMVDRPWAGFGWGQAETVYGQKYCPTTESAAIEMNDYLMIGISAGVPAMVCFVVYVLLGLKKRQETGWKHYPTLVCRAGQWCCSWVFGSTADYSNCRWRLCFGCSWSGHRFNCLRSWL